MLAVRPEYGEPQSEFVGAAGREVQIEANTPPRRLVAFAESLYRSSVVCVACQSRLMCLQARCGQDVLSTRGEHGARSRPMVFDT